MGNEVKSDRSLRVMDEMDQHIPARRFVEFERMVGRDPHPEIPVDDDFHGKRFVEFSRLLEENRPTFEHDFVQRNLQGSLEESLSLLDSSDSFSIWVQEPDVESYVDTAQVSLNELKAAE